MISRSQIMVEIGRDTDSIRSSIRWEKVTALNDNELQVLLTLLRNTYSAIVSQASIRGIKPAAEYVEPTVIEKKDGN